MLPTIIDPHSSAIWPNESVIWLNAQSLVTLTGLNTLMLMSLAEHYHCAFCELWLFDISFVQVFDGISCPFLYFANIVISISSGLFLCLELLILEFKSMCECICELQL